MNITDSIKYVGMSDEKLDYFEGQYKTPHGMSYNSYIIMDEKIAVLDTVDARFKDEWLSKVEKELGGKEPDYLVVHHMEPDHSSNIKNFLDKSNFDFDYDGVVIKVDYIELQDKIGTKDTRAIEWGIARKWNEDFVTTTQLNDVEWQVGRTGVVTPVGKLEPVECGGVVISNVTLNNVDFIKSLNIHIGDMLKITRSGGVIPYVLGVSERGDTDVKIPEVCPVCGERLVKVGALLKCVNDKCTAIEKGKILQLVLMV